MSAHLTIRRVLIALALAAAAAALVAAYPRVPEASGAGGATAAHRVRYEHLTNASSAGRFFNYDGDHNMSRRDRDWPITLIFYRNASINKVKAIMNYDNPFGGEEFEGYKKSKSERLRFDRDRGRKKYCKKGTDTHYRVYAPGDIDQTQERFYDPTWGYFTVASTHYDHGECAGSTHWYGLSEQAEIQIVTDARDITVDGKHLVVRQDFFGTHNKEPYRRDPREGNHRWQNDGKASAIKIP